MADQQLRPFRVDIAEAELDDLRDRLGRTRFPDAETADDWSQGVPLAYLSELVDYWRNSYDMRRLERRINDHPQLLTAIDGLDIHALNIRSPHEDAIPLVMTHGWPGSVVEFLEVIGPLTDPVAHGGQPGDAFHLVLPSLPGYGFSGKPTEPGWGIERIADAWDELMGRLGYDRYVAQGGDWGSAVTSALGARHPERCVGIHLNMVSARPTSDDMAEPDAETQRALAALAHYQDHDSGYSKQQSTRPQTLGYGLTDSPAGQLAWIVEKFWAWTDCGEGSDRHPERAVGRDAILDNVTLYWLTASAASSARLYWESFGRFSAGVVEVPTACSIFPREIIFAARRWAERRYPHIVHWNEVERGGHFAAFEQPELFVDEVRAGLAAVWSAAGG